jgi:adenylate kinase family enzyme
MITCRISIVGTSGSGKTTLAKSISQLLSIPHVELDYLHWEPNWVEVTDDIFSQRVSQALTGDAWVVDGNYSKVRNIVWDRADTVIFLDYSFPVVMGRILWRSLYRSITEQEICNGNRESLKKAFFEPDSILLWVLQTYRKNRKAYPLLFQQPEYSHLNVIHQRSPKET